MENAIQAIFYDSDTGQEIDDITFYFAHVPQAGNDIHYWQDGTEEHATGVINRRDYRIVSVRHDCRFMPGRAGGRPLYVQSLEIFVKTLPPII